MNPTSEAMTDLRAYQARRGDVAYIGSFEAVFDVMFGPRPMPQHDAHVAAREANSQTERLRRADEAVKAECARMSEATAQNLAAEHGFDTAALRRRYDTYATGCFSKDWNATAQRRITLRALDIAIERAGGNLIAAE